MLVAQVEQRLQTVTQVQAFLIRVVAAAVAIQLVGLLVQTQEMADQTQQGQTQLLIVAVAVAAAETETTVATAEAAKLSFDI
jgi:hypothetical protein